LGYGRVIAYEGFAILIMLPHYYGFFSLLLIEAAFKKISVFAILIKWMSGEQ